MEPVGALSSQPATAADGPQYLTFRLGAEEYGVEILKVQEIRSYSAITPVPNTPRAVKGVMNLRGQIIPVRSEEHTSELQSRFDLVCRLLLEKKKNTT